MPTPRDFAILNALVTFAAENIPGGLTEEERRVAQAVGRIAAREAPLENVRPLTYNATKAIPAKELERGQEFMFLNNKYTVVLKDEGHIRASRKDDPSKWRAFYNPDRSMTNDMNSWNTTVFINDKGVV